MPLELRRRSVMDRTELAPIADTRETEAGEIGPNHDGVDDGLVPGPSPPTNGVPRNYPNTPTPVQPHNPQPPMAPGKPGKPPLNVNQYATKKTVAQGMMDLALLTANANQLRYVLEAGKYGEPGVNYYISITLISFSIILQLMIGVALIFLSRYNVSKEHHAHKADTLNNWVVLGVFLITVINVFISSFSVEPFHGVDPVLLKRLTSHESLPADVTESVFEGGL